MTLKLHAMLCSSIYPYHAHLCRSLLSCPSSLFGNPPTLSAFLMTSLPLSPSRSACGRPHHSLWNFSCSFFLASFASLSFCLFNRKPNHSSLAASCSAWVAWATMQVFIARFCALHLNGAVNVRPNAQSANNLISAAQYPRTRAWYNSRT